MLRIIPNWKWIHAEQAFVVIYIWNFKRINFGVNISYIGNGFLCLFDSLINRDLVFFDYFFVRKLDIKTTPNKVMHTARHLLSFFSLVWVSAPPSNNINRRHMWVQYAYQHLCLSIQVVNNATEQYWTIAIIPSTTYFDLVDNKVGFMIVKF